MLGKEPSHVSFKVLQVLSFALNSTIYAETSSPLSCGYVQVTLTIVSLLARVTTGVAILSGGEEGTTERIGESKLSPTLFFGLTLNL